EKGLAPLADLILAQNAPKDITAAEAETKEMGILLALAAAYVDAEKGVESAEDALAGASDIIAETISDDAAIRKDLRELIGKEGFLTSKAAKADEDSVYRLYYEFKGAVSKLQSHQILAMNRGEREEFLKVELTLSRDLAVKTICDAVLKLGSDFPAFITAAAEDAYDRLIFPSLERETRSDLTDTANEQAIRMFGLNLEPLLMQPPVKNKVTLGFDPAYRTGCKIAVVDGTGKVLATTVVYPTPPHNKKAEAAALLKRLIAKYKITAIAIGNGTASKESEIFISELLKEVPGVAYMMVNEAGASVYSASKLGAEEFPDFDVSLRSAVSIARRLQDPLAELVKIDPKAIGVGQYQHDMPQTRLGETLTGVVENCVGRVGVDLNTASPSLLARVSGLNATIAKNIVAYREENGIFTDRKQLTKVPKLGPKTFVQCAGFLRIAESKNILDNTAVHPESYEAAQKLLELCGYTAEDVRKGGLADIQGRVKLFGEEKIAQRCGIGVPTLRDMLKELSKPGRDPRDELPAPMLRTDVLSMEDLKPGMEMKGTVRNVVDFGVFVDIGVHQDGLVHISQCADRFIKHPSEVLKVGDVVNTVVLECDPVKKRISLSIRQAGKKKPEQKKN
ncbi:MAG: RNA-binding transcriptional accessory protein, partial [Clostridiales bacterium]|nr:RNA-binding transcriptional accessory protein [Clostridiales bacterium]